MIIAEIYNDFKAWVLAFFKPKNKRFRFNPHEQTTAKYSKAMIILVSVNFAVFFALMLLKLTPYFETVSESLAGHTSLMQTMARPWSVLTYGFVHISILHFAMNMFGMIAYMPEIKQRLSERQIYFLYFFGVLVGAGACILYVNAFSDPNFYVGASAGIYALITYIFLITQNQTMSMFGLRFTVLRFLYFVLGLDVVMCILDINGGGSASHLGGAALAWLFYRLQQKNVDISQVLEPIYRFAGLFKSKRKPVAYKARYSPEFESLVRKNM
jgi:membrane associated rhomboid family serine protease